MVAFPIVVPYQQQQIMAQEQQKQQQQSVFDQTRLLILKILSRIYHLKLIM